MSKILDDNGDIGRDDFIKFSQDSKLLDFGNVMGEGGVRGLSVMAATAGVSGVQVGGAKKTRGSRASHTNTSRQPLGPPGAPGAPGDPTSPSLLCCCLTPRDQGGRRVVDKVEIAFNKFDLDNDGYLSWEEFQQVSLASHY